MQEKKSMLNQINQLKDKSKQDVVFYSKKI